VVGARSSVVSAVYEEGTKTTQDGPRCPAWHVPEKRPPKAEEIQQRAESERSDHALRLAGIEEMNLILNDFYASTFRADSRARELGQIEPFVVSSIRDEHDRLNAYIAQMELKWTAAYTSLVDRDEAIAKQSFLNLVWGDWQRKHSAQGYGPLRVAIPDTIQRFGMIAAFVAPDTTNEATGIDIRLLDPGTIFPVHDGKRGLSHVYCIYSAPPHKVIGDFDDPKHRCASKVRKLSADHETAGDHSWQGEVVEYWSREWAVILYEGEVIRKWRHGYYRVPMVIKYGCFGQQGFTSTPHYAMVEYGRVRNIEETPSLDDRRMDLARKAQPFLKKRVFPQQQEEKFGSRLMTMFRYHLNPSYVLKTSPMSSRFANPVIDTREGALSQIGQDDELMPLEHLPDNGVVAALQSLFESNRMTGMAKGLQTSSPSTQASGTARQIMAADGFEGWAPVAMIEEEFLTEVGELCLEWWGEMGDILGPEDTKGHLPVPQPYPDPITKMGKVFDLTQEMIRRTGTRIECELFRLNESSLANTTNAIAILIEKGLIDDRTAVELLNITADPERLLDSVKAKKMETIPIIEQMSIMRMLRDMGDAALMQDPPDQEAAEDVLFRMGMLSDAMQTEWAIQQVQLMQAEMQMQMAEMGVMPGMMEGGPPPPGGPPGEEPMGADPMAMPMDPAMEEGPLGNDPMAENLQIPGQGTNMGIPPGVMGGAPTKPPVKG
jgi:hypothetical protein